MNKVKFSNKSSVSAFLIACCTIFFSPLHAQYDDLLRKNRYTWVAEYTADYELNPLYSETVESEMNLTQVIHLGNEAKQNGLYHDLNLKYYLSDVLLPALRSGAFACYADEHLTQLLASSQIEKRLTHSDTVASFDPPEGKPSSSMICARKKLTCSASGKCSTLIAAKNNSAHGYWPSPHC